MTKPSANAFKISLRLIFLILVAATRTANMDPPLLKSMHLSLLLSSSSLIPKQVNALESLADFFLIDPKTGNFRPDDKAILVDFVVADGDTKGPKKFISKQAEIVGDSWEGKAE